MENKYLVILDPGHGKDTPGKRSPKFFDGRQLEEWKFARQITTLLRQRLEIQGISVKVTNPNDEDISLSQRGNIANDFVEEHYKNGGKMACLVSIHGNACGDGSQWMNAHGWEVFSTVGKTNSDKLAQSFLNNFPKVFPDLKLRGHKEKNFTVIYKCNCPCVLTENFFYDNKQECEFMLTREGLDAIVDLHFRAICEFFGMM